MFDADFQLQKCSTILKLLKPPKLNVGRGLLALGMKSLTSKTHWIAVGSAIGFERLADQR